MKTILNKTRKPVSVPLPGGKRLFLSPGKTGQIASNASDHPPLIALVEAGEIEILDEGSGIASRDGQTGQSISSNQGHNTTKASFRRGDS